MLELLGVELVSKELDHFGEIADLFRQIGGYSSTFIVCVSVLRGFALVAFGDLKISINYNCLLYIPFIHLDE